ncbi:MAG: hypothetical protein ABI824_18015 [Acidobacteriota bacterium]
MNRAAHSPVISTLVFDVEQFDNEADAVNSFFPGRRIQPYDILTFVRQLSAANSQMEIDDNRERVAESEEI